MEGLSSIYLPESSPTYARLSDNQNCKFMNVMCMKLMNNWFALCVAVYSWKSQTPQA